MFLIQIWKKQLSFFGHIVRHSSIQRDMVDGRIQGRRARGRQRKKWTGNVGKVTGLPEEQSRCHALGRVSWRSRVANLLIGDAPR